MKIYLLLIVSLTLSLFFSCNKNDDTISTSDKIRKSTPDESAISDFLCKYLNYKYDLLIKDGKYSGNFTEFHTSNSFALKEAEKISILKTGLAKVAGISYLNYNLNISIDTFYIEHDLYVCKLTERFILTSNKYDNESKSVIQPSGINTYKFMVKIVGNDIKILEEYCDNDPWHFNENPIIGSVTAEEFESQVISPRASYNYDPQKALAYAYKYVYNYNTKYCKYDADCQNFLSQILEAGGWTLNSIWGYAGKCNNTLSWINCKSFLDYVIKSGRIYPACYPPKSLLVGDFVIADWTKVEGLGKWHDMFVSKKSGETIFLTYHTTDRKDVSIYNLPKNGIYYCWRVKSSAN